MYRPKGWENPYNFMNGGAIPKYEKQSQVFEDSAVAFLEGLKKDGFYGHYQDGVDEGPWLITDTDDYITFDEIIPDKTKKGWVVFIPEE